MLSFLLLFATQPTRLPSSIGTSMMKSMSTAPKLQSMFFCWSTTKRLAELTLKACCAAIRTLPNWVCISASFFCRSCSLRSMKRRFPIPIRQPHTTPMAAPAVPAICVILRACWEEDSAGGRMKRREMLSMTPPKRTPQKSESTWPHAAHSRPVMPRESPRLWSMASPARMRMVLSIMPKPTMGTAQQMKCRTRILVGGLPLEAAWAAAASAEAAPSCAAAP
mmetsp:Transcript_4151/g.12069  ORF Transcript_4151/g.12069 Transcript_4151/m.12069 type:complete len:222 (+) Transcript_4151:203-868(+)